MSDGILLVENEDGLFKKYDDTFDVVIHCENKKEQDSVRKMLTADKWIPVQERLPESEGYILLSFDNSTLPDVGRYEVGSDGSGAFYLGDDDNSCVSYGLFVNAWMPLPERYEADAKDILTEKPQTNEDRIRSMTDEELAEMLSTVSQHCVVYLSDKMNCRHSNCDTGCKNNIKKWLQKEMEEKDV